MSISPTRPFVGLRPYTFADAPIFFERRGEAEQLRDTILAHRVVMLFGDSGNGKSSLINAGLLPLLVRGKSGNFLPERLTISEDFTRLCVDTGPIADSSEDGAGSIWSGIESDPESDLTLEPSFLLAKLKERLKALEPAARPKVLIMFDQFEELHTRLGGRAAFSSRHASARTGDEQASRREAQLSLARTIDAWVADEELKELPVKFLFAFREEYLVKVQALVPTLRFEAEGFRLPSMRTNRFEAVVKGPFQKGSPFEPQGDFFRNHGPAVARAFEARSFGEGQNILSEIQVVCGELWDDAQGLRDQFSHGGPADHVKVIDDILANFFQRVIRGWGALADPAIAVLCELVTDDKTRDIVSDSTLRTTLCEGEAPPLEAGSQALYPRKLIDEALAHLLKNKIVFRSERGGVTFYDIAGESIIPWISEERRERILKAQTSKYKAEARKKAEVMALVEERSELIIQNERSAKIRTGMRWGIVALALFGLAAVGSALWAHQDQARASKEKDEARKAKEAADIKVAEATRDKLSAKLAQLDAEEKVLQLTEKVRELSDLSSSLRTARDANETLRKENEQILSGIQKFEARIKEVLPGTEIGVSDFEVFAEGIKATSARINETISKGSVGIESAASSVDVLSDTIRLPAVTVLPVQPDSISDITFVAGVPALLATGSMGKKSEGSLKLFALDGAQVNSFKGDSARISAAPEGNRLVSLPWGRKILRLHDRSDAWKPTEIGSGGDRNFSSADFSADGKWLVLGVGSSIQLWDQSSAPPQKVWEDGGTFAAIPTSVAFSPDSSKFVAGSDDNHFAVFSVDQPKDALAEVKLWRKETVGAPLRGPTFSADGQLLLVPNGGPVTYLFDMRSPDSVAFQLKHEVSVVTGEISPDGRWIATATSDGKIHFWKAEVAGSGRWNKEGEARSGKPRSMTWKPNSNLLATADADGVAWIWDPLSIGTDRTPRASFKLLGHRAGIGTMEFTRDGRYLASGDDSGGVRLWDFDTMRAWQMGSFAEFGGPNDPKLKEDEGLALIGKWAEVDSLDPKVFLPGSDRLNPPRAKQLDPTARYIAMRWDYTSTSKKWLRETKVFVMNPKTGKVVEAQPVDWGPGLTSGRLMHLSPGLAAELELGPGDTAATWVPTEPVKVVLDLLKSMRLSDPLPNSNISHWFAECEKIDKELGLPVSRTDLFVAELRAAFGPITLTKQELVQGRFRTPQALADILK